MSSLGKKFLPNIFPKDFPPRLVQSKIGIWDVTREIPQGLRLPGTRIFSSLNQVKNGLPYFIRFLRDVFALGPVLLVFYIMCAIWSSFEPTVSLYYSSELLNVIQARVQGFDSDSHALLRACVMQILIVSFSALIDRWSDKYEAILRHRIKLHFAENGLRSTLKFDLPTLQDPEVKSKLPSANYSLSAPGDAWVALTTLRFKVTSILDLVSQCIFLVVAMRRQQFGPIFVAMCIAHPFLIDLIDFDLWSFNFLQSCNNANFIRMSALQILSYSERFKRDIISDGAAEYIESEFHEAKTKLGDTSMDRLGIQWMIQKPSSLRILSSLVSELPIFMFCIQSFISPSTLSAGTMAILRQTAQSIQWCIRGILLDSTSFAELVTNFKDLYILSELDNKLKGGNVQYPARDYDVERGMQVEFRNVSFAYPGTEKKALNDVSFLLKPGQLAVIVGVNGSGKSSLTKLFNRLYDPTEGQVLIDDLPLSSYKLSGLRRAMAILCQDHHPYPVSLRENVAIGLPTWKATDEEVTMAIRQGGAYEFIEKLPKKLETNLDPVDMSQCNYKREMPPVFRKMMDAVEQPTSISGGESQRLAASRTFMRLSGGEIRLLVADEPTSALDPQAEYEMYQQLLNQREGKTVVFITHRFGHITKHADVILCMKDGALVEQGTHLELVAARGEYFRLHEVQAQAFAQPSGDGELVGDDGSETEDWNL